MTLNRITWTEAQNQQLATARGFKALKIPAGTIRRWAHEQRISAVAKAPGGAHLYSIQKVSALAEMMMVKTTNKGACK